MNDNIYEGLLSSLHHLCKIIPGALNKVLNNISKKKSKVWGEDEKKALLENLSICILNPEYTEIIGIYFQPWLLEILGHCSSKVGKFGTDSFDSSAHFALCVCFSKLLNEDVIKFVQLYFQEAPSPFCSGQESKTPVSKKPKLSYEILLVGEAEIMEATYNLLKTVGIELGKNWEVSDLLEYTQHGDDKTKWFACNSLALLVRMNERERNTLVLRHVSSEVHLTMTIANVSKNTFQGNSFESIKEECITSTYTCKVGKVLLPLFSQNRDKNVKTSLVMLPSTKQNLEAIALGISSNRPVLIEGGVGSGKTSLVEHLGKITGRAKPPQLSKIQLSDQTDSKTLIGTYRCTANPGEFIWKAGTLTQAVSEGYWLLLEDIDLAPIDVISLLIPLLESRMLPVPGHGNIKAHPNFKVFATRRILPAGCMMRVGSANLLDKLWFSIILQSLDCSELITLICTKWPKLEPIAEKLVEVYLLLSYGQHGENTLAKDCSECVSNDLALGKISGRFVSVRDLLKWCSRTVSHLQDKDLNQRAFLEALDCFCAAIPDKEVRYSFSVHIASHLNVTEPLAYYYFNTYKPDIKVTPSLFVVGQRCKLKRLKSRYVSVMNSSQTTFSKTRLSSCLLEKITVAVMNKEPVLVVGETGTGKTSTIQYLSQQTNHPLRVINMNQQSDSSDLFGGFKPVEVRTIVSPLRSEFEDLFVNTFSAKRNNKFLSHIMTTFSRNRWNDLFALMEHSMERAVAKLRKNKKNLKQTKEKQNEENDEDSEKRNLKETIELLNKWNQLQFRLKETKDQLERIKSSLAFAFMEGTLVKAIKEGDWVLLDEINLASADTLECLTGLLESSSESVTLHERGDDKPIVRHTNFRLFACMNPATDVGKKELPVGIRNRFTEFFMEEFSDEEDLMLMVHEYLGKFNPSGKQIKGVVEFYKQVKTFAAKELTDGTGHKPHFSLRTLCRALIVTRNNPCSNLLRSLYEAFCLSFLTQLDRSSYPKVTKMIVTKILGDSDSASVPARKGILKTAIPCPGNKKDYVEVERFWVPKGSEDPQAPDKYILTQTVRNNLHDLVRVVSIGQFPVLLQGETSVGKTSLITYLAKLSRNKCVRINNHQHTDLQEYVGSYAPDESGKLVFKEGVLVNAMKNGHWIILDELNLAPSDVLEALNRLLDENRELFIPEIETTVKAHPKFILFATQNPPGHYGGRQILSRAFRNRFVELHFSIIPSEELQVILEGRCEVPSSLSKKMVEVLKELQNMRRASNIFEGKQSFVTLRDLFRWAERYRLAPKELEKSDYYDWDQHMADEGFLVLAAKIRFEQEAAEVKKVLKRYLKREVNEENLFNLSSDTSTVTKDLLESLKAVQGFEHIVWTQDMRKLFVLISKALGFCEPVLLVGETGCGKTTVCQVIAAMKKQRLFTVNCHMHTEGADFLGGLRPVRDRIDENDDRLFEWVDGPLIQAMKDGGMFLIDEISLADDSVLERLNSVLEPERTLVLSEKGSSEGDDFANIETLTALESFRLVATMNPGGDYGKKELSPALRNRLTEIWCHKVEIERPASDVKLIIQHNIDKTLNQDVAIQNYMLQFLKYFTKTDIGKKLTVSIRDILSWVTFINKVVKDDFQTDLGLAYVHGACLVFLDSLGSGTTASSVVNWRKIKQDALQGLCLQARNMTKKTLNPRKLSDVSSLVLRNDSDKFGIEPYLIPKGNFKPLIPLVFSFKAPQTCRNLLRLLMGLQLSRPILLEGSPGVGKTSLVVALAKASDNDIVRINLSEQTDVSDLFGADLPEEGSKGGRFAWRNGPLLEALKKGSWVVLDELNLASQSVLEGLNACFDHRGEIFVPELNKTFTVKHHLTKIFACQNPQYEGGARKGLPKSFLNRFTQVFIEPLSSSDLEFILGTMHSEIPYEIISMMVNFNGLLLREMTENKKFGTKGGPWELNLRDMIRWCEIMLQNQSDSTLNPGDFVELIYSDRLRTKSDRIELRCIYEKVFPPNQFPYYQKDGPFGLTETAIQAGRAFFQRKQFGNDFRDHKNSKLFLIQSQVPYLESLINCINMNWMTLVVGNSGQGKTNLIHLLAELAGEKLETLAVNSHMDVTELLGGFEQADYGRRLHELIEDLQEIVWQEVRSSLIDTNYAHDAKSLLAMWKDLWNLKESKSNRTVSENAAHFLNTCDAFVYMTDHLMEQELHEARLESLQTMRKSCADLAETVRRTDNISGGGTFEWVDSPLVKAVRNGHWLLIDGVNLCSPSVLDRLNGLLEPGGVLTVNERGVIGGKVPSVVPHPNFRLFLAMDPMQGEISRAMRNRGIEICLQEMWEDKMDLRILLCSEGLEDSLVQNVLIEVHSAICEALPGYERPNISSLSQSASITKKLLQFGFSHIDALELALQLVYLRKHRKPEWEKEISNAMESALEVFKKNFMEMTSAPTNKLFLSAKTLLESSAIGYPLQLAALTMSVKMMKSLSSKSEKTIFSLPEPLPSYQKNFSTFIFLSLASLPIRNWESFRLLLVQIGGLDDLVRDIKKTIKKPSMSVQLLEEISDGVLSADPRFNKYALRSKLEESSCEMLMSLSNKALIGLWIEVNRNLNKDEKDVFRKKLDVSRAEKQSLSVLELSRYISECQVSEKLVYHPSLRYIYLLLKLISTMVTNISNDVEISISDDDFFKLRNVLAWCTRLSKLCSQTVSKDSFHLFLPLLVFYWKQLRDTFLDAIPVDWEALLPEQMNATIHNLKNAFLRECSPLHYIIPELRENLGHPLPFSTEECSVAFMDLSRMVKTLTPDYKRKVEKENQKLLFLGSEHGHEMKNNLINIAVDLTDESSDKFEIMEAIQRLNTTFEEISNNKLPRSKSISIQMWPLIDYLASLQLAIANSTKNENLLLMCNEALTKSSCFPLHMLGSADSSRRLTAISCYLFNISNTSAVCPSKCLKFEPSDPEDANNSETSDFWEGEETCVLSPMGCLLTYQLLVGFCKPDQEIGSITVGNHAEREFLLNEIRLVLWQNWNTLAKPTNQYEYCFEEKVKDFVQELTSAMMRTMETAPHEMNPFPQCITQCEVLLQRTDLFTSEGSALLSALIEFGHKDESSLKAEDFAYLGVVAGLLQSWLMSHIEPLDPAKQRSLLLSHSKEELSESNSFLLCFKWIGILQYNHSMSAFHPHIPYYEKEVKQLKSDVKSLSQKVAHRPEPSQYHEIVQNISHFMSTIFLPSTVMELIETLRCSTKNVEILFTQVEGTLRSCDKFIKMIMDKYPLYRDLVVPLVHGVVIGCESLRVLMVLAKNKDLSRNINSVLPFKEPPTIDVVLSQLLNFPSQRDFRNPENSLTQNQDNQKHLESIINKHCSYSSNVNLCQALSLRASIYDLYNQVVATKFFSYSTFLFFKSIIERVLSLWREREEERKKKAEEEESLFKYKSRSLAISETEDEEISREYKELFPDFEGEFKDLHDNMLDSDEEEEGNPAGEDEDHIMLTDEQFEEFVELHKLLTIGYVETPWISPKKNVSTKILTPVALRTQQVQILMRTVGPYASHKVDAAAIGSLNLVNYLACSSKVKSQDLSVVNKPFNYYHDSDLGEALKIRPLLEALDRKVDKLLQSWSSHPSLLTIKKVIHRVLGLSVTSPLIRLVIGLEMTLEKSQDWEKNAHRGVSLMDELTPITNQIIEWRKMELSAWGSCLDMISYKVSAEADKYWPHLYESLLSVNEENLSEVIQALKQFLETSLIGNFFRRLEILRAFHSHLNLEAKYCNNGMKSKILDSLIHITWNFYRYYSQFSPLIEETLKNSRKPIEKKVKDYIKISRWNDINFFSVKDSVVKSRRTLHRHMRNWDKSLRQPFSRLMLDSSSDLDNQKGEWDVDKTSVCNSKILKPLLLEPELPADVDKNSYIGRLPSLTKKSNDFIRKALENMPYKENVEALEEFSKEIISTFQELSLATSKAENISDKEERMQKCKDVVNRKKKSLSVLFKTLHHLGISYTKGNALWKEEDLDKSLVVPPLDIKVAFKDISISGLSKCWDACDKYFYKGIGRHALLSSTLHQAHGDLGPEDVRRLRGSTSHLMLLSLQLRQVLPELCVATSEIDASLKEVDKAIQKFAPAVMEFQNMWADIYSSLITLSLTLEEQIILLKTFPNSDSSVITLLPSVPSVTCENTQRAVGSLEAIISDLSSIIEESDRFAKSSKDEVGIVLSSFENIEEMEKIVSMITKIATRVYDTVRELDPAKESSTPICKALVAWLENWNCSKVKITEWMLGLNTLEMDTFTQSAQIENCLVKALLSVEKFYKHHKEKISITVNENGDNEATKFMVSNGMVVSLVSVFKQLNIVSMKQTLWELIFKLQDDPDSSTLIGLKSIKPVLVHYLTLCKNLVVAMVESFWALSKLLSILLGIFLQLGRKGFCKPQELQEQEREGGTKFEESGPGLAEEEGKKDVSDRLESEDQLESALQEGEKEPDADQDLPEEDGIEMSQDFDGKLQNREPKETEAGESDEEEEEEEEHDKQMGKTEVGAEKIDEKLWGDEEENKEDEENNKNEEEEPEDEHGPGDTKTTEAELVAKDDNKDKTEKDEPEKKEKKELEVMDEDRRQQIDEEDEETYEDNFQDPLGGKNPNDDEGEDLDLPDDLNIDDEDGPDEEEDTGLNPEIDDQALFPEEEREPKDNPDQPDEEGNENGQNENEEGQNNDQEEGQSNDQEEGLSNDQEEEEKKEEKEEGAEKEENEDGKKQRAEGEKDPKPEEEYEGEKALPSQDKQSLEEAQAADMETMDASKDKTKDQPESALGAQPETEEEQKQEEHGQMGEETEDNAGVGQSDSKTREDAHKGENTAISNEEDATKKTEQTKERKPGDIDQLRSLGETDKEIHLGLMTKNKSKEKEQTNADEEKQENNTDKEPEGKESSLYEHVGMADDHFDKQTVDAGTQEEAKLRPAPLEQEQEEEAKDDEELEGVHDSLIETEENEKDEKPLEERKKRENDLEGNEGPDLKKLKGDQDPETQEHEIVTEGDIIPEMVVQRPSTNQFFTLPEEEEVSAMEFNEDVMFTREQIEEAGEGDAEKGIGEWSDLEGRITPLSLQLCEQLRLILEPTEASKLRGDYRTGKRLNMRKVIPYIASQFRKDKIWLRRTQPNKRSYQVLIAVDDSQSMSEVNAGDLARESVALVAKALTLLEVGQVGVISFGNRTQILHPFHKPFTDQVGATIFANIKFNQTKTNFAQMLEDSVALLAGARGGESMNSDISQLLLILSDGQTHARSKAVRAAVRAARESRVFVVFLVLDAQDNVYSFYDACVYEDGELKSMIDTFPFPYFLVVRDLEALPDAIAEALRQWFELVTDNAT